MLKISSSEPEAMAALEAIYTASGQTEDLIRVLEKKLASGSGDAIHTLNHLAQLSTGLNRADDATAFYRRTLEVMPSNDVAFDGLARLYRFESAR